MNWSKQFQNLLNLELYAWEICRTSSITRLDCLRLDSSTVRRRRSTASHSVVTVGNDCIVTWSASGLEHHNKDSWLTFLRVVCDLIILKRPGASSLPYLSTLSLLCVRHGNCEVLLHNRVAKSYKVDQIAIDFILSLIFMYST